MTTEPVQKLVSRLAAPSIVIMLVMSMYNVADTFFVSSLGTSATAAVGIVFSLLNIIQAAGFFFGQGGGNFMSRALGAKDQEKAERMASTAFFTALLIGVLFAILGTIFLAPIAKLLGSTPTIMPFAVDYMRITVLATPFMMVSYVLNTMLRYQGRAIDGMVGMVAGAIINTALDPLFIFVFDMGILGAGLATFVGQMVGFGLLLFYCSRGENIRIRLRNFTPKAFFYKEMFRGGSPSLLRQSIASVSSILLNTVAGGFGDAAVAAISISNRIAAMVYSVMIGTGQGFQPVCGFNYGAKFFDRVKKAYWFTILITFLFLIASSVVIFFFAPEIVAIFRADDPEVIKIGTLALRAQALSLPLNAIIMISNMMMQTIGKVIPASILAISRQGLFLIPVLYILVYFFGLTGVQICTPVADACAFLLTIPLARKVLKDMK